MNKPKICRVMLLFVEIMRERGVYNGDGERSEN